jgi:hypothetical protein
MGRTILSRWEGEQFSMLYGKETNSHVVMERRTIIIGMERRTIILLVLKRKIT